MKKMYRKPEVVKSRVTLQAITAGGPGTFTKAPTPL
jgi:hypothetical protein